MLRLRKNYLLECGPVKKFDKYFCDMEFQACDQPQAIGAPPQQPEVGQPLFDDSYKVHRSV